MSCEQGLLPASAAIHESQTHEIIQRPHSLSSKTRTKRDRERANVKTENCEKIGWAWWCRWVLVREGRGGLCAGIMNESVGVSTEQAAQLSRTAAAAPSSCFEHPTLPIALLLDQTCTPSSS